MSQFSWYLTNMTETQYAFATYNELKSRNQCFLNLRNQTQAKHPQKFKNKQIAAQLKFHLLDKFPVFTCTGASCFIKFSEQKLTSSILSHRSESATKYTSLIATPYQKSANFF